MTSTGPEESAAADLVRRIRAGDRAAEAEMIRRYSRPLMRIISARVWDRMRAEDLHQQTFLIVLEKLQSEGLKEPTKLPHYIRKTACNLDIGDLRRDARRKTNADSELLDLIRDSAADPLDQLLQEEGTRLVRELLEEMVPRDREVLKRIFSQQTKKEICAELGIESDHYDRVKHRALQRLKALAERRLRQRARPGVKG